jgi:hypothetical protein
MRSSSISSCTARNGRACGDGKGKRWHATCLGVGLESLQRIRWNSIARFLAKRTSLSKAPLHFPSKVTIASCEHLPMISVLLRNSIAFAPVE